MGVAWLSRPGNDGADPFVSLCRIGLRLVQGLGELIRELPSSGSGAPSFLIGACHGLGDQEHLGSGLGPTDHLERHALLRATVVGPDPLELDFLGRPPVAIDRGEGSALSPGQRPSLGPLLSGSRPNSRELVGFLGDTPPECPSFGRGRVAPFGELA
jgi:hypothetical protein